MKAQDIFFLVVLLLTIAINKPKLLVWTGLICLVVSVPLFSFWIFFTAQILVYYAAGFILVATLLYLFRLRED